MYRVYSRATSRCLGAQPAASAHQVTHVVLLPCNDSSLHQLWTFDDGVHTVSTISNAATGEALAVANATLRAALHSPNGHLDVFATPDSAYGLTPLVLVTPYAQPLCTVRNCQSYDPTQKWYWSPTDGKLRHSLFTASINDRVNGEGYQLTSKVPTWRHHCLAHVLSDGNTGTPSGHAEVWGGPLAEGSFVLGLVNRYTQPLQITAPLSALGIPSIGRNASFTLRDVWDRKDLGRVVGAVSALVPPHDLALFRLSP